MIEERYELALDRIRLMQTEDTVGEPYRDYFKKMAEFVLMLDELRTELLDGRYQKLELDELRKWNRRLYQDVLPGQYEKSYANPDYACKMLGKESGQILGMLYAELRGAVVYVFEGKTEYLAILYELLIEVYNQFEEEPDPKAVRDTFYWYASDYCDVFLADRILEQIDPSFSFAADLIETADLDSDEYLYRFGEYISKNELGTAHHLRNLPQETLQKMADVYTEGYRIGFINTGKDLSKKKVVNIRYSLGFEKVVRLAIENFKKMGLKPVIYRAAASVITKREHHKIGYYGCIANQQYEYDHRQDQALFMDKRYIERKLEVMKTVYEQNRELAAGFAGPAVMEIFGETPFSPEAKASAPAYSEAQRSLALLYDSRSGQLTNEYIKGDERSFTIIAYPVPEIGSDYAEIFNEVIRINTLEAKLYEQVQQTMIDALDQAVEVHVKGKGKNKTDLYVAMHEMDDPSKETNFENCLADVNIPVGEVFTSPKLTGTNGVLHVGEVYLNDLKFIDLEITFKDGMISEYTCKNFKTEEENKAFIKENLLYNRDTLPMGEFAIGTNTTAYVMAKTYDILYQLPILIVEKMGPHFAVGDTCYSHCEETEVHNPDGKEIVAKYNECSKEGEYFQCHTDITIPYEELDSICAITLGGDEILLIKDGKFVLSGTETLNEPLTEIG